MAINRLQFGGLLNPTESFDWPLYKDALGPEITTPTLLGSGIFGQTGGTGTGGCQFGYHRNRAGNCVPDTQPCPTGQVRNAAGQCVTETQPCPTGQVRNSAGQCVDTGGACPTGKTRNAAGNCVPIAGNGTQPCPDPNHHRVNGVCVPKDGTGTDSGCPALWSRDQWGICRPPEKKDVTTLCGEGEIWSGGKCHPTGQSCPDPTTHWDAFTGRCLPNEQDLTTCRWGRNPHTDQCNPNPNPTLTTADIGAVRTTPAGGILTDTGLNTGDYRLDYSPYGAEDRGQDERSRILAGILDGGTTPYSPILSPAQELAAANRQAAIDFETAPGLLAAIEDRQAAIDFEAPPNVQQQVQQREDDEREVAKTDRDSKKANTKAKSAQNTASKAKAKAKSNPTRSNEKAAAVAQNNAQKAVKAATTAGVAALTAKAKVDKTVYKPTFKYTAGGGFTGGF